MDPLLSLFGLAFLSAGITLLFWPDTGLFWRWRRGMRYTRRVVIEDALKHLYDQEYKGLPCTLQSISGSLSISGAQTAKLMARLELSTLVKMKGETFKLTKDGRSYALRMIRVHRLWERFLADETGIDETEWHDQAERLEHNMSEKDTEALAASTGYPSYDPHGDPIPTSSGSIPARKGQVLTDLEAGEMARIIHIEDEPTAVYAQLVAEGLHPGMIIRLTEKMPQRISLIANGNEIVMAPVVAANVTVDLISQETEMDESFQTLASLNPGEKAEVQGLSSLCRGQQRRRIMDLGVIPGTIISAELKSWSGDPTAYLIRGATIALREQQAKLIRIKPIEEAV